MTEKNLQVLTSYLSPILVRQAMQNPQLPQEATADSLPAAVFFADIAGFTTLTNHLIEVHGPNGVEKITELLNTYFEKLIAIIDEHGGEVVKFAGDALLALWPVISNETLAEATLRATQCGLAVQNRLKDYQVEQETLSLRVTISAGTVGSFYLGGIFSRWEFLVTGQPLIDVAYGDRLNKIPHQVLLTPAAAIQVQASVAGQLLTENHLQVSHIIASLAPRPVEPLRPTLDLAPTLKNYIPGAIKHRLDAGQTDWLAELRYITVLFVNLPDLINPSLDEAQTVMHTLQTALYGP